MNFDYSVKTREPQLGNSRVLVNKNIYYVVFIILCRKTCNTNQETEVPIMC